MDWEMLGVMMGSGALYVLLFAICLAGLVASGLTFSGTWFVVVAAALAAWLREAPFPGWGTLLLFVALSALTEVFEFFSSAWGVDRRGGSKAAGFASMAGGILGLFVGQVLIPLPVVGAFAGMMIGSFGLAYYVEYRRLKVREHAAHIAMGAVAARVLVIFVKMGATLGMTLYLFLRMALSSS